MIKMKNYLKITLFILITVQPIFIEAQTSKLTKTQWLEDLNYVVLNLKEHHPHIYYRISEADFNYEIDLAKEEIKNSKSDLEAFMALKRVVARVQDGHTQVWDNGFLGIENLRFPIRVDKFTDGVFITVIRKDYQKYLGAKLLKINNIPIDKVLEKTTEKTNIDKEEWRNNKSL